MEVVFGWFTLLLGGCYKRSLVCIFLGDTNQASFWGWLRVYLRGRWGSLGGKLFRGGVFSFGMRGSGNFRFCRRWNRRLLLLGVGVGH